MLLTSLSLSLRVFPWIGLFLSSGSVAPLAGVLIAVPFLESISTQGPFRSMSSIGLSVKSTESSQPIPSGKCQVGLSFGGVMSYYRIVGIL